jgi:predicted DNA-binding transcriptional regulator AlpA
MSDARGEVTGRHPLHLSGTALTSFLRYNDLVAANIVKSWTQLLRLIENQGFPPGRMLSPNVRAWTHQEVEEWLAARPTERKPAIPLRPGSKRGRPRRRKMESNINNINDAETHDQT